MNKSVPELAFEDVGWLFGPSIIPHGYQNKLFAGVLKRK